MSKMLEATCSAISIVTADGVPVPGAVILSQGKQVSSGVLILDGDKAVYLTSNASDIKTLITNVGTLIDQISAVLTGLDAVTTVPGSNAALITALGVAKTQFLLTKDLLK